MNIGQAARTSGVSAKMIRYYEQIGLVPPAARTGAGYRDYSDSDVHVLRFVRQSRDLGFPVADIANLLSLWRDQTRHSAEVRQIASAHVETLERKIREMQEMVDTLRDLIGACHGDQRPDCPILNRLEAPPLGGPAPVRRGSGAI
ncbi:Cu(I)-responsive transcriptional regulator [Paracoccus yeei]|uniref:Cu(I)-responsive transcriptional regulator n=1 Tax=Paracoccus yeei TaxID=147645 RepID=A0A1V0GUQ4_9RHOB|nr:Cu(I)-responsive transcriptional regulator [Paracoccus yeei]ARC37409.1 Cu(I)-responsive transcriptional regulator [Paracoccus yeei]